MNLISARPRPIKHLDRKISTAITKLALNRGKMAFISGPRQSGKTTLAKNLLPKTVRTKHYFSWDDSEFRKIWTKRPDDIAELVLLSPEPIMVLDEFHKNTKWKNQLKGFYDRHGENIQIIVTGSAKLNVFRKGADSLLGRFIHFHLLPFSLGELSHRNCQTYEEFVTWLAEPRSPPPTIRRGAQLGQRNLLTEFGGFPEPLLSKSKEVLNIWTKNRNELLIRQDLKDLSNILHVGQVEILASFIPDRVGSPLSIQSLASDLDGSYSSVQRWLNALEEVYFHFVVRPYSHSIPRSLKKEGKIYLWDWTGVKEPGPRFENMVACHLLKLVHFYNDTGQADLNLQYLRTKDKQELDFLVTNRKIPLFSVEAKLSDVALDPSYKIFQAYTQAPHFQIVADTNVFRSFNKSYVVDFDAFFGSLP